MKPYTVNFINSVLLILLGGWAYLSSETPSVTALIPVFTGILLLAFTPAFKKGNRFIAHLCVVLTLLVLIGLFKPLTGAIGRDDTTAIIRVIIMMAGSLGALIVFIRSFIAARSK